MYGNKLHLCLAV